MIVSWVERESEKNYNHQSIVDEGQLIIFLYMEVLILVRDKQWLRYYKINGGNVEEKFDHVAKPHKCVVYMYIWELIIIIKEKIMWDIILRGDFITM